MGGRVKIIATAGAVMVLLAGCGPFSKDPPPVEPDTAGQHQSVGAPADSLQFDLQPQETPNFDVEGWQSEPTTPAPSDDMFIEKDGYAYRLDPATLEPIDIPLDPVTHEPISMGIEPVKPTVPVQEEEEPAESAQPAGPSSVTPTEDTKYPNTGIFLEDD